jgi:serine phosphatase RsbU (regulator of sigma subunit)
MSLPEEATPHHSLHCMEIWGGNHPVESAVTTPGLDAWVYSKPFEGASRGGDVHYVSLCGGGIITRIILADVSGHGETVAEFAASLRTLMRKNINRKSQTRLVEALNRQFAEQAQLRRFATAVVATYLASRNQLTICNAGHPRPLWYSTERKEWSILSAENAGRGTGQGGANLPLGIDEEAPYDQFAIALGHRDLVIFYTDALIEAKDPAGAMLGEAGLLALARGLDPADPANIGPALRDRVAHYRGERPADDDVTLLTLHHNGGPPRRPSLGEKLDVYAKVFGLKNV